MNKKTTMSRGSRYLLTAALAATAGSYLPTASALPLYDKDGTQLNFDFEAIIGTFHSEESYELGLGGEEGSVSWQEGYAKYGFSGSKAYGEGQASLFGAVNLLTSATRGDGDAAGFTTGDESETDIEDAYIGWRSGKLIPALGDDGLEISVGRQNVTLGDGFLINGDSLNFGEGFEDLGVSGFDRGGAYWLAARKAFDKTVMVRLGGESGLRSDLFWLESDNAAQAKMELAGINLEYVGEPGTLALTYIEGLDVDEDDAAIMELGHRDGQETLSVRAQGNAGVENLFLSAQYVDQEQGDNSRDDAKAYYVEAGWTFADVTWSPSVSYRFANFDEGFDPLFFGFNRGYGTWFQGEVAANYAGPFNSDADVHHLALKASPSETLSLGALFFDFSDTAGDGGLDAQEINLYAEWVAHDHLIISPLLGFYSPDHSAAEGGTQIGNDDTNTYFQMIAIIPF